MKVNLIVPCDCDGLGMFIQGLQDDLKLRVTVQPIIIEGDFTIEQMYDMVEATFDGYEIECFGTDDDHVIQVFMDEENDQ